MKKTIAFLAAVGGLFTSVAQAQWVSQGPGGQSLSAITFYNANIGWACGSAGSMYKTTDGGATWSSTINFTTTGLRNRLRAIAQPLATRVIVIWETPTAPQPTCTYISNNSGQVFQLQDNGTFNNFSFRGSNPNLLVGDAGTLYISLLSGGLWIAQPSGTQNNLRDGDCPNSQDCYIVGDGGTVRKTNGALSSWRGLNSTTSARLNAVWFTDGQNGYIAGDGGTALHTINGGTTWTRMPVNTTVNLYDVRFLSPNVGFIVGELGTILLTTDGGATWQAENTNLFETLYSIASTDDGNNIWVAGDGGTILKRGPVVLATSGKRLPESWNAYPNPFQAEITIDLPQRHGEDWHLTLLDNTGRVVLSKQALATQGTVSEKLSITPDLKPGIYWLRLQSGNMVETRRLLHL